jgi:carbon storage regulator
MLVLSRKKNESIVINDDITVLVVEIREDKVRLGIDHPRGVPVHRREVYDAIRQHEGNAGCSTVQVPDTGVTSLATIRKQVKSSLPNDGTLIAAILEAVAAKGITAEDLSSFVKEI